MRKLSTDHLERHSLLLMASTLVGHVGNYAYHVITGRMLPEPEYGLLMALFGAVNLLILPMSALNTSLTRAVASLQAEGNIRELSSLLRVWFFRLLIGAVFLLALVLGFASRFQSAFEVNRFAPLLLAAAIPGLNLLLTLTGAGLQGLQLFTGLALRGSLMFIVRAMSVWFCLTLGFTAAGWGLLAHLIGMSTALGVSAAFLLRTLPSPSPEAPSFPVLKGTFAAFPVLFAFTTLMTADVILVRVLEPGVVTGYFAQSATLGRMILWLPMPIAQVMFPKVVRSGSASSIQKRTVLKALGYTLILTLSALLGVWIFGSFCFRLLFGVIPTSDQLYWLRGISACMALLVPVYVVLQYELARGRSRSMLPLCGLALVYVLSAWFRQVSPTELIHFLAVAAGLALITSVRVLVSEPDPPPTP